MVMICVFIVTSVIVIAMRYVSYPAIIKIRLAQAPLGAGRHMIDKEEYSDLCKTK